MQNDSVKLKIYIKFKNIYEKGFNPHFYYNCRIRSL